MLAVEKRITSSLMEPTTIEKIVEVDKHCALAFSGLTADSKMLVERARVESQNHWFTYDEPLKVESIAQAVSNLAIQFGDSDGDGGGLSRYECGSLQGLDSIPPKILPNLGDMYRVTHQVGSNFLLYIFLTVAFYSRGHIWRLL